MSRAGYVLCGVVVALASAASWPATPEPAAPESPLRTPDQTFLTYPEWFLVFSPDEYATYLQDRPPSAFPYGGHLGQLWSSYAAVSETVADRYPFNGGYHAMIVVIAGSTTVEYGIKGGYERTVGRTAEAFAGDVRTAEDQLAADVAREYVDFIEVTPWYAFDFDDRLRRLWSAPPKIDGTATLRSLERRYALTTEYALKAVYARVIAAGTAASYEAASPNTQVAFGASCIADAREIDGLEVLGEDDGTVTATVPRYRAFSVAAAALAEAGCTFETIAGNDGEILLSVMADARWTPGSIPATRTLFVQPLLTDPMHSRFAVVTTVPQLSAVLQALEQDEDARVEHVFDY